MADNTQKVSIKIDVSGEHIKQLKALAENVSKVTVKVKELQTAIDAISGGTGKTTFSSSHLVSALGEVKTAIAAIKDTGFDRVSKALDSLNDQKLNNFAAAVERLKAGLDSSLIQNTSAFADAIKRMGEAQSRFSGAETARQVNDLLSGLQKMENINAANLRNISSALSELNLGANLTSIEAISKLGYALRSIKDFGEGKNPLNNLADGMRSLIGLKQSDTFLYRVRQITLAAALLARSEPVDFSKFTKALQELGQFDYKSVKWENIKQINAQIKEAFEDLRTVKVPNIKGLMQGLGMVDETYKSLKPENLRHIATTLVEEFGKLSQLKMPQLGSLTKNLRLLSSGEYDFNKVAANVNTFKQSLMDLNGVKLPNIGNFFRGFEVLQNVSFKGMDAKVKSLVDRVNQLKTSASLDGWDNIKVPNLHSFIKGIHDLGSLRLDEQHLQNINHNIRSIPNKLREIAGIQVPDLSKFATGLLELGRSAVNAQKVSNVIGKSLNAITENLPQHELKLPNLSGLTKGIRDFQLLQEAGKVDENSIKAIIDTIKGLATPLKSLDKVSLPNIQGIANAIHKLSTAVPENAGSTASTHINAIVEAVKKLDGVKTPDITKISNAFKTLNETVLVGQSSLETGKTTTKIQENINALKTALDTLRELPGSANGRLPNLKSITDAFKVLNDTTLKTEEVFRNGRMGIGSESVFRLRNNLDIIKQAISELQALNVNAPKMPDLKSVVNAFKDLNSPLMKLEESWKLGKGGLQSESIYRFHNNMETIKKAISDLQALGGANAPKIPSLKGVLSSFKELNETVLRGYSSLSEGGPKNIKHIYENIDAIKAIYTALQSVSIKEAPKIPSLKGVMAAFRELNDTTLKGAFIDNYGNQHNNVLNNLRTITHVITELQALGKKADGAMPSLSSITTFFKTFNEKVRREGFFDGSGNWTGQATTRIQQNAEYLKNALLKLAEVGKVNIPNLSSITTAFKVFNESTIKGAFTDNYGNQYSNMLDNLAAIKHVIKELQALGSKDANKIPSLSNITAAFRTFNDTALKGTFTDDFGNQHSNLLNNLATIKHVIKELQSLGGKDAPKIPNLSNIIKAFKTFNEDILKGYSEIDAKGKFKTVYNFDENIKRIKDAIKGLQKLNEATNGVKPPSIPNLKNVTDAFKVLNDTFLKGSTVDDFGNVINPNWFNNLATIKRIITELQALGSKDAPRIPNLKNISDAFRVLNENVLAGSSTWTKGKKFGKFVSNIDANIAELKKNIKKLQALNAEGAPKIPNLKGITEAFKVLNESVLAGSSTWTKEKGTGEFVSNITRNIDAVAVAITKLQELGSKDTKIPNLKNITDAFKIFNNEFLNVIKGGGADDYGNVINRVTRIRENIKALYDVLTDPHFKWDSIKLPNVKNIADAFKTLNSEVLERVNIQGEGRVTRVAQNLRALKDAFEKADFSTIKIPNLKNISDAFRTLNNIEKLETVQGVQGTPFRIDYYVNKIAQAFVRANDTLRDVKLPNLKNISDAFRTLNNIEYKEDKQSNFVRNLEKVWEQLRKFKEDTTLQDIKFPNIKNIAEAFKILDTVPKSDKASTGNFNANFTAIKGAISELKEFDKVRLPNVKNLADAFRIFNESVLREFSIVSTRKTVFAVQENVKAIKDAIIQLKETGVIKLPNLKNIADAFTILNKIPKDTDSTNVGAHFKANITAIASALSEHSEQLSKVKLPNLKNLADAYNSLNVFKPRDLDTLAFRNNIKEIRDALKSFNDLYAQTNQGRTITFPNLDSLAKGFKTLNEISLQHGNKEGSVHINNMQRNIKAITTALQGFEGKNFDIPNIKNLADGLKKLNDIATVNQQLPQNMETLKRGLEVINGFRAPQLKNFADGLHSLDSFSKKSTGELVSPNLAKDLSSLVTVLEKFTGIQLPSNLAGFAKGIEAINKVNIEHFSKKFSELIKTMHTLNLNVPQTAIDALTAKLVVCEHAIRTVEGRLNSTTSAFAGFGKSVQDADAPLTKFQERIKTFLQYRVISNVFNQITNWMQSIPENIKEFEKAMYNVQSITGATDMTIAKLGVTVKEIASTTKFSAQEVADGMTMIAQAGFTAGQSMQMMQSISNLATGTLTDMRTVVDLVTSAMVVFGIESNNSARVSDVFANAVNKSKLTMEKIRTAFNYIGPVARDANISFEESAVAMMLLANSGQKASTIGTGLRNVLSTILSPSKKLAEAAATVGVSLTDLDPRVNSFRDVLSNLGIVVRDSQVALDVFGKRGATAVLSLTNGIKDYDRLYSSVTRVGSAAEMAAKQQEGLYVRWKNLGDRAQLLAVTLGENGLTAIFSGFIDVLSGTINFINSLNETLKGKALIRIIALTAAVGSLTVAFKALWAMRAISGVMFSPLIAAVSYLTNLFPTYTKRIGDLKQNFKDLRTATTASSGTISALNTNLGNAASRVTKLGLVLRTLGGLLANVFIITAPLLVLGLFDGVTVMAEKLEHNLQKISEQLDKIHNQINSTTHALEKITKLQPKTEEYANAIKEVFAAIKDNGGAVLGAETEFQALVAAINETNDAFTDGGAALDAYRQKLRELAVVQAVQELSTAGKLFRESTKTGGWLGGSLTTKAKEKYATKVVLDDFTGEWDYDDLTYSQLKQLLGDIAIGKFTVQEMYGSMEEYTKAKDRLATITQGAEKYINNMLSLGKISLHTPIEQVMELAKANRELKTDALQAIEEQFKSLQEANMSKAFSNILAHDLQEAIRNVNIEGKGIVSIFDALGSGDDKAFNELKRRINEVSVDTKELKKQINETAVAIESATKNSKSGKVTITTEDKEAAVATFTGFIKLNQALITLREEYNEKLKDAESIADEEERSKRVAKLTQQYRMLNPMLEKVNEEFLKQRNINIGTAALVRGIGVVQSANRAVERIQTRKKEGVKASNSAYEAASQDVQNRFWANRINAEEYNKEIDRLIKDASKKKVQIQIRAEADVSKLEEDMAERLKEVVRSAIPISTRMEEIAKEEKDNKKRRDTVLQSELNRIQIQEDAYKQSEGRIGLAFKEARAKEQEAHARYMAARLVDILRYEEEIKNSYRTDNEETKKALEKIQEMKKAIVEEGYRAQHELDQRNTKAAFFLAKEQGDAIANQEKRANEQRKRRQEKALHEIATLESKDVISHEKAELKKAEISVKYHDEIIKARKEQIAVLKQLDEAQNIQQIVRLEEEIEKSTYDAVKAARQGIEAQTKAVYKAEKKLKELQGESFKFNPLGDFNANQQAAITAEYAKEVEKRKKLIAEGFDLETDTIFSSTSKVAEEVRKHYDKVDSIAVKSAEKRETLEQTMLKKKEEYEKKKLDITKKYDAKALALEDERQDAMDTIDAKGNSKKLQKRKTQRAERRIRKASGSIAAAVEEGDKQELEALFNQLQSATSTLMGAEKPGKYKGDIQRAFDLRKQILEAQKQIELKEEEKKFQRELKQDKRRLEVLKSSAEQALLAENGRHELAMSHLEKEAEKIREQIKLAKELMSVYNEQISKGEVLKAQEKTVPAGQKEAGVPTNEMGTWQGATNKVIQGDDFVRKSAHDALKEYGLDPEQYKDALKEIEAQFKGMQKTGEQSAANVTNAYKGTIESFKAELAAFSKEIESSIAKLGEQKDGETGLPSINPDYLNTLRTNLQNAIREAMNELRGIDVGVEVDKDKLDNVRKSVQGMIETLNKFKAQVQVNANITEAKQKITSIVSEINNIPNKIKVEVVVDKTETVSEANVTEHKASGGLIFSRLQSRFINKGSGTKDDVPALLMKNEFVHRAAAVKKYGVDFMYKLNNLQIPASITKMFANGGIVGNTVGFVQKYANGGLIRSTKRKLEELFAGSGINLNVNNLDISTKLEQAANEFTSPIGIQAMGIMAKNIEEGISRFVTGGAPQNAALNAQQMQDISKAYSDSIFRAQASGNATIARALRDERNQITILSEELQQNLVKLHRQYTEEVSRLDSEHNRRLQEKKAEYNKNVREENAEYEEKVYADEKRYTKEDEEYEASKKERKENYDASIKEIKDNLEEERLSYEADLLSKQQALTEKEAALQDFRNQLHSDKYPVGFAGHENASIEELITAHAEYARQKYGSDKRYIIDLGGLVKTPDILSESAGDKVQSYATRLEKMTASERSAIEALVSTYMKGLDSSYFKSNVTYPVEKESDYYNRAINEYLDSVKKSHGRAAYLDIMERFAGGSQELPPEQNIPYVNYLFQHLYSDYTIPLEQARNEYLKAKDENNPDTKATKEIKKLTEEFNAANKKAEEERKEVLIERKKAIDERETSHKEKLAELKQDYDNFVQQENAEYDKSASELKETNQESIVQVNVQHSDRLKLLKNNTAQVVSSAKEAMAASINAARRGKTEAIATASISQTQSTRELDKLSLSSLEEIVKKMRSAFKFATGGLVPFTKGAKANTDSVLSLLSPNEFVMSAKAVRTFGINFMQSLNNLKIPAFATGGMVGANTPVRESTIDKIMNKTVYALDLTLNNTHIGELTGEKDTIDSFMFAMDRARMGMI